MTEKARAVIVSGPTASGKSSLALALAAEFGGWVINADSMQVYRELEILTARPGADALAAAPHRLYGVLPGAERCSVGRWLGLAQAEIRAAREAGALPILVGGTGLYFRALERGLAEIPEIPPDIRYDAVTRCRRLGAAAFHAELAKRDPVMAERLHPHDGQRLIRAWEVFAATGRSLADWQQAAWRERDEPHRFLRISLVPERDALYAACDRRLLAMMAAGGLDEVRRLRDLALDPDLPIMRALGVPPLLRHLEGELDIHEAVAIAQRDTRHYAKRQLTWQRTQVRPGLEAGEPQESTINSHWSFPEQYSERLNAEIFSKIRDSLLTPLG